MAIMTTCRNGHVLKVKDEFAGKTGLCPHCRSRVFVPMPVHTAKPSRISDDEILGVLGPPSAVRPEEPPVPDIHSSDSVLDSGRLAPADGSAIDLAGSSIFRKPKEKICPKCSHRASIAFNHCPCCGTPLPEIEMPK